MKALVTSAALAAVLSIGASARAQPAPTTPAARGDAALTMAYRAYLGGVLRGSLALAAERANVHNADALIDVARAFPDPVLTGGANSVDVSGVGAQNGYGVAVTVPIEFPLRRSRRIEAARQDRAVAAAQLEDQLRQVRAAAATAYVDAMRARLTVARRQRLYENLTRLVELSEQRFRAGDTGRISVTQARVEAERFRSELIGAEAELRAAELALATHLGSEAGAARSRGVSTEGDLSRTTRQVDAEVLVRRALLERPDLLARRGELTAAAARVELAQASRAVDVALNLAWQYNTPAQAEAFRAPGYHTIGATLSVPLPFSRVLRGDLDAQIAAREAAESRVRLAELTVESEVRSAAALYEGAARRLELFSTALLEDAEQVFESTLYSYRRGTATLFEVITAQRTLNDVQVSYLDALAQHARAWVALQSAAGVWSATQD